MSETRDYGGSGWVVQSGPVEDARIDHEPGDGWVYGYAPAERIGSSGLNRLPVCWQIPVLSGAELVAEHTGRPICTGVEYLVNPDAPEEGTDIRHDGECPTHPHRPGEWRAFYGDPLVSDEERARREAVEAATGEPWCNHDAAAIGAGGVCECGAMLVEEPEPDAEHEAFCEHYDAGEGR